MDDDSVVRTLNPELPSDYHFVDDLSDRMTEIGQLDAWFAIIVDPPEELAAAVAALDPARTVAVSSETGGGSLVASHSSYPFEVPTPGGSVPAAGLTWLGVHPQHRRRGILAAMMARHFADCRDRDEPVSVLFASEPAIYQRFGYATASFASCPTLPRKTELLDVPGWQAVSIRLEEFEESRHSSLVERLHRQAARSRPGWVTRSTDALVHRRARDPEARRGGGETRRIVIAERDGQPTGYAHFRRTPNWTPTGPAGSVTVWEPVALDAPSARALWGVLTDMDLTSTIVVDQLALDDPLFSLLVDIRQAQVRVEDNLFLRIVDLPAALIRRTYSTDIDLAVRIIDDLVPANDACWRLATRDGQLEVTRSNDAPAAEMDIRALSAAYLGGRTIEQLADAGQVLVHDAAAMACLSQAFTGRRLPFCSWIF